MHGSGFSLVMAVLVSLATMRNWSKNSINPSRKLCSVGQVAVFGLSALVSGSSSFSEAYQFRKNFRLPRRSRSATSPNSQSNIAGGSERNYKKISEHEDFPLEDKKKSSTESWPYSQQKSFGLLSRPKTPVSNVEELRQAVLDQHQALSQLDLADQFDAAIQEQMDYSLLRDHGVLQLMQQRFQSGSTPGQRQDNATLALAIEGGGMRGCVSAGMAAAICSLGLSDTIDSIYGSSAGSVIGSYMVSRQMCVDVYVDILPAAKKKFVCKKRLVSSLAKSLVELLKRGMRRDPSCAEISHQNPGMNISFVLDGIMGQDHGIRPLDLQKFEENNRKQPLRVVASCLAEDGKMVSRCFGSDEFFGNHTAKKADGSRVGLEACLEASMTVPGATGAPVDLTFGGNEGSIFPCFDAFCFEPIPYRSAVEEGATHVMALCSRPLGFQPKTKPGVYEKTVAPLYFYYHGQDSVASFFENGGQQYLYAEDLLILRGAKQRLQNPVLVPPPKILYGVEAEQRKENQAEVHQRQQRWKKAHLFPVQVPPGTPELGTLEQDKDAVLEAVRGGFSATFDLLAPIVGLQPELMGMGGDQVAKLVFPDIGTKEEENVLSNSDEDLLTTKIKVPGEPISIEKNPKGRIRRALETLHRRQHAGVNDSILSDDLLKGLPGFQGGRLNHLAKGLRNNNGISYHSNER